MTIRHLNEMDAQFAVDRFGGVFENSPWIVAEALQSRPFASAREFHEACMSVVNAAGVEKQVELIRAHPDLVGRLAREGRLSADSTAEQRAAGLENLTTTEIAAFERYNAAYREKFAFPFVICARRNRKETILSAFPERLTNERGKEIETAIQEIGEIAWLRIADLISDLPEPKE